MASGGPHVLLKEAKLETTRPSFITVFPIFSPCHRPRTRSCFAGHPLVSCAIFFNVLLALIVASQLLLKFSTCS